jgi:hypothetical protein
MMKFSFACGLLLAAAIAGCGGGDDSSAAPDAHPITLPPDAAVAGPDAPPAVRCDTANQTGCTDAANPKCSVSLDSMNNWSNACKPLAATPVAPGGLCMRMPDTNDAAGVGNDNCDKGGYCTAFGNLDGTTGPGTRHCHTFCRATAGCGTGEECMQLTDLSPPDGICITGCTVFDGTAGGCTGMAFCGPRTDISGNVLGVCETAGNAAIGSECSASIGCVANAVCITDNNTMTSNCRSYCDISGTTYPMAPKCGMTETCTAITGLPTGIGVCLPN